MIRCSYCSFVRIHFYCYLFMLTDIIEINYILANAQAYTLYDSLRAVTKISSFGVNNQVPDGRE